MTRWLALALLVPAAAWAQPKGDPDWPCPQRLVPVVSAAALWPEAGEGDWRAEPDVATLVGRIAPRAVEEREGVAAIEGFAAPLGVDRRRRLLPLAFAGALEETNAQRGQVIEQIRRFARHQRELAGRVRGLEAELRAAPPEAREELEQRHAFAAKTYTEAERTLRYACEVPVRLEARLGAYARALRAALPPE
ncbi:hypothetical protein [Paracraurococcus lichenis]|uniref:Uncharacterized protein n=1 Tax=Paracraurococcus lichenis TaxID=3064888 RepID=A0ABT9E5H9_9PROT|nr:hypothetical protein [Paracraurococcus sp. LOR1-02]MDO9711430.1 hypothetical protein [Paracraurococcus sp. LOR1-02]